MEQLTGRVRLVGRTFFDSRVIVAVIGVVLSVVLHELFHVIVHWGDVSQLHLFPDAHTIAAVSVEAPYGYDAQAEEAAAYTITLVILLITAAIIAKIHDAKDTRSVAQIIAPKNSSLKRLSSREIFELAARIRLI